MNLLAGLMVVFLGLLIKSDLLVAFGVITVVVQIILDYLHRRPAMPVAQAAAKPKLKHKLIDAPEDAWKVQEDDIWQAMQAGPAPMVIGGGSDFLGQHLGSVGDDHARAAIRNMLPFSDYANSGVFGAVDNLFFGLPFNMQKYIRGKG